MSVPVANADADLVFSLIARREGPHLDFKRDDYDWRGDKDAARAELAKDLMAMANALTASSAPAYILVGVAEEQDGTGRIIGLQRHLDDADLHQRVSLLLNRVPTFSYERVDTATGSVGVYTIRPGKRPYYPLREFHVLKRFVAVVRDGSHTDVASPDLIATWVDEDDPERRRASALTAEVQENALTPQPMATVERVGGNFQSSLFQITVVNGGGPGFQLVSSRCVVLRDAQEVHATSFPWLGSRDLTAAQTRMCEISVNCPPGAASDANPWDGVEVEFVLDCRAPGTGRSREARASWRPG